MSHEDRTRQPTNQRRQRARLEGNVAVSGQVTAAVVWLAVALAAYFGGGHGLASLKLLFEQLWATPDPSGTATLRDAVSLMVWTIAPILVIIMAAALIGRIAQVGQIWAPQRVLPKPSRVGPSSNLGELFSLGKLHQALFAAGLMLSGIAVGSWGIWSRQSELLRLMTAVDVEVELLRWISTWGLRLGVLLVAFAVVDYACQRYRFEMSLRMSPEELRAEIKAIQGNPQVAGGQREMRREIRASGSRRQGA